MATQIITCPNCQLEHYQSDTASFKLQCNRCHTIIGSSNGKDVWYDTVNYTPGWRNIVSKPISNHDTDTKANPALLVACSIVLLFIIAGSIGLYYAPAKKNQEALTYKQPGSNVSDETSTSFATSHTVNNTPTTTNAVAQTPANSSLSIYSGECFYSKKELNGSEMILKKVSNAFAKVVINRKLKKLYFYYDGKLVFQYAGYWNFEDTEQGGEGFTFDSDADAHRYTAEKTFILNTEMLMGGQLGYQYEIAGYREN